MIFDLLSDAFRHPDPGNERDKAAVYAARAVVCAVLASLCSLTVVVLQIVKMST